LVKIPSGPANGAESGAQRCLRRMLTSEVSETRNRFYFCLDKQFHSLLF